MKDISGVLPGGSHVPVLLACLQKTDGPILEFGVGCWSTPLVGLFAAAGRYARSVETNVSWHTLALKTHYGIDYCRKIHSGKHELIHVNSYDDVVIEDHFWDIVFLDHLPPERRGVDALRLRDKCCLMIAHDSQHPDYEIKSVFRTFKYRLTDYRRRPATTVASDDPLDWLAEEIPEMITEDNFDENT